MAIKIPIITEFNGTGIKKAVASFKQLDGAVNKAKFAMKAMAVTGAAAIAAIGVSAFQAAQKLGEFAKMAADDEKGQKQLALSIKASTKATDAQIDAVNDWIDTTQRAVGVADDELRPSYARIIRSTKDFEKAQRLLRLALDVSAGTGKPLKVVTEALSKAYDGSNTALQKLGLGYDKAKLKGMEFSDVQKDLEKRFSGAALDNAQTFEGVMARFSITMDELKETLGESILPFMQRLAEYGIQVAEAFDKGGVAGAFEELKFILNTLLYDENGALNAAGQQLNELINKLNAVANFINRGVGIAATAGTGGLINVAQTITGRDFTPNLGTISPLGQTINAGSLRGIRGSNSGVNITVQTGIGDPVSIGRQVYNVVNQFERRNGGR